MFPSPKSSRPAYTLVELLLFTGILSLMAGSIVGFSVLSTNVSTRTETMAEVEQGGELVMQRILQEIQNTDFIVYPQTASSSDTLVLATVSPKREVIIHLFHDRIRMIENGTEISFLTTEHIGIDDLSFLHFGGSGAGEGISVAFLGYNKSIGTTLYKKQYSRIFRGTAVLHGTRCSTDTDCSGGDTCCSGICRVECLDDCNTTSDCTGNDVCCIINLDAGSYGDSECLSASACETAVPKCASLQDCPISEPYFLVSGVKIFCNQTNCQYTVPVCTSNVCSNVALGPCDVCSTCGDGSTDVTRGEECDDGDTDNADICTCTCTIAKCGDNIIQPLGADDAVGGGDDEDCDDGNTKDDDGCDSDCQNENLCVGASNNGTLEEGEECDDGNASNTDTCDNNCRVTVCGDGTIQSPNGHGINELCDDGNVLNADSCSSICQTVTPNDCGNGILEAGEDCDDGKRCTLTGNTCQEDAGCPGSTNVCNGANIDGCTTPGACIVSETPESTCNDASDNDCDGFTDCVDVDCDGLVCATGMCSGGACVSGGDQQCNDLIDNDAVGGTDCADADCISGVDWVRYQLQSSTNAYSHDLVDIDSDGDLDIVGGTIGGFATPGNIVWHENDGQTLPNGDGIMPVVAGTINSILIGNAPPYIHTGDMDKDTDIDVVSAGGISVYWHNNNGSENFTTTLVSSALSLAKHPYMADLNEDTEIDILAYSRDFWTSVGTIYWFENDGAESFTTRTLVTGLTNYGMAYPAFIDADAVIDVVVIYDGFVTWFKGNGDSPRTFTRQTDIDTTIPTGGTNVSIHAADLDGDTDIDVLAGDSSGELKWYKNDGTGSFGAPIVIHTDGFTVASIEVVQIGGSSDVDILATFSGYGVIWFESDGAATPAFTSHTVVTDSNYMDAHAGDINGGSDIEISTSATDAGGGAHYRFAWFDYAGVGQCYALGDNESGVCTPTEPGTELTCSDHVNNDCNEGTDCVDPDCDGKPCKEGCANKCALGTCAAACDFIF
jgi:cysteine-rich repeat protein